MKKIVIGLTLSLVLMLSACSTYQEVSVNEKNNTRVITTEQAGELEVPLEVKRGVMFRATDPLNAHLLGVEPISVNEILKNNKYINENLKDITFIKPGDLNALKRLNPDLIITYAPDEYASEYQKIAPTIEVLYNSSFLSPYKKRVYLTHLYHLGVMLNKEEEAKKKIDEWFQKMTELKRELKFDATEHNAVILTEIEEGYQIVPEFASFGSEAVFDVLGFQYNKEAKRLSENHISTLSNLKELENFDADYVFINTKDTEDKNLKNTVLESTNLKEENIIVLNINDYRTNDLISVEAQTREIIEQLNEK